MNDMNESMHFLLNHWDFPACHVIVNSGVFLQQSLYGAPQVTELYPAPNVQLTGSFSTTCGNSTTSDVSDEVEGSCTFGNTAMNNCFGVGARFVATSSQTGFVERQGLYRFCWASSIDTRD